MPKFKIESNFPVEPSKLQKELLNLAAVNFELAPHLSMSAPEFWGAKPISQWPVGKFLFSSQVKLFGLLTVDCHDFKFSEVSNSGFIESSKTRINKEWHHRRSITETTLSSKTASSVTDTIEYKSKLGFMGFMLLPMYRAIFKHRHNKLKQKYG